jgi:transposase
LAQAAEINDGFRLWQKRPERHVFRWPTSEAEVMASDSRELSWLLDGLDPLAVKAHSRLGYSWGDPVGQGLRSADRHDH